MKTKHGYIFWGIKSESNKFQIITTKVLIKLTKVILSYYDLQTRNI